MQPTKKSVRQRIAEFKKGEQKFLKRYAGGVGSKAHYVVVGGNLYPAKAIWAAAHKPSILPKTFNTRDARNGFRAMGYDMFVEGEGGKQSYMEGKRHVKEVSLLMRSARLVAKAKKAHGFSCQVCKFNFRDEYGTVGTDYIEAHHIEPLSGRDGVGKPTSVDDIAVLCSNCHRMVHRTYPGMTLDELRMAVAIAVAG